jgi:alpha-mannosidase
MKTLLTLIAGLAIGFDAAAAVAEKPETSRRPAPPSVDLAKDPTLYVVGYAHLDTQWRWAYPQSIREYIPATLKGNFALFEKYPDYIFNFSGSRRYQFMKEYYPADYETLKKYIAQGRWFPCGSSVDENDANVPSGESQIRHVLYGNKYFQQEFGVTSEEFMLPDCFGFPASLPQVLAHCGLKGFSTQKLTWNAAVPLPFKVGTWEGPDGSSVIAALDPGEYVGQVRENLANSNAWTQRIKANGKASGVFTDYHYFGTGDQGGAPKESSVKMVQDSVNTKGAIKVVPSQADWLFKAITPEMSKSLPKYKGELMLTQHSAGSISSEAYMKRWNRKNELLADAAERAAVAASWLGGRTYPGQRLEDAWYLLLGSQMHDILPGTSLPMAYSYSWNDEVLAGNQFSSVLADSASVVISQLDTNAAGTPVVVYNATSSAREDVVEAFIPAGDDAAKMLGVSVTGPDGKPVAAQVLGCADGKVHVAFVAAAESNGYATYGVKLTAAASPATSSLRVTERELENADYLVKLNDEGDVASIFDKETKRELLSAPARLGLHYENPKDWPAWNQDWTDRQLPAKAFVGGPTTFKIVEKGPARVAIETVRTTEGSTFTQRVRLSSGGGSARIEFDNDIKWQSRERSLRASFPLTAGNPMATYDLHAGVIERPNYRPNIYEYLFHQWFDLTDAKGDYGVSVMSDSKYACDKPDDHTVRLTLLYTPGTHGGYQDQGHQDLGRHRILYALQGHKGDWRSGDTPGEAARLNQPLVPFVTTAHAGPLGKSFSLASVSSPEVSIMAIKKAEASDEVIVRLRQLTGRETKGLTLAFASPVTEAREVDGQERTIGAATVKNGAVVTDIRGYGLKAFALKLGPATAKAAATTSSPVALAFDTDAASTNEHRTDGAMDATGAYPAEQFPKTLSDSGVQFTFGSTADGAKNAVACKGQTIELPKGSFDRLHLIAAASEDVSSKLTVGGVSQPWNVQAWGGFVGQWDTRLWAGTVPEQAYNWSNQFVGLKPGYVKQDQVAWYCTHHHTASGDAHYLYSYLFHYTIDLPKGATSVTLPNDARIKVFAATATGGGTSRAVPAAPLFDTLADHVTDGFTITGGEVPANDATEIALAPGLYWNPEGVHYTTDGSEPTAASPAYTGPITLNTSATVRFKDVVSKGGASASRVVTVNDVTPPRIYGIASNVASPEVVIRFSEKLEAGSVTPDAFKLMPPVKVTSAALSNDGLSVTLRLAAAPELGSSYSLQVKGVTDVSPAHNTTGGVITDFTPRGAIYSVQKVTPELRGKSIGNIPGMPTKGTDPWTLNMFIKPSRQPDNHTIFAGFGTCHGASNSQARYLAKFATGLHFWSANNDVESSAQLDLNAWQMITASYDGATLRVYKNATLVAEQRTAFADDVPSVTIAPKDPWDRRYQYDGEIAGVSVWGAALDAGTLASLQQTMPKE